EVESQQAALDMVQSGEADAAVVDYTFAKAVTAKGNKYSDLGIGFDFSSEAYCVAFSKDSDITVMLNTYIKEEWEADLSKLATKYGLTLVND
ncbi:MAG: transporter substrate-binding domain-containing protein, partial [Clostridia bacterium]|nr:transporter substrate-binding domain-containing protein [Clostridia bacterium]